MCGIFGVVYRNGETIPSQRLLQSSASAMAHRGPDGSGIYGEPGIGLAHTRLSLLDLDTRSNQPFWDAEGRHCIVYNGEIYNFREIRSDLARRGIVFRTTSDTEVLLMSLVRDGAEATLDRLRGMFAFAWYDRQSRKVTLARDRYGIKPLFLHRHRDFVLFGSEVKVMRPWIELKPNPFYVTSYLLNSVEPTRNGCIFEGTEIVPPGSLLVLDCHGNEHSRIALDLALLIDPAESELYRRMSIERTVDRFDELLNDAVRTMLLADAPVGALCSGGVDSSLIAAIAARYQTDIALFHAEVIGNSEYEAASALAKHLNLQLHKVEAYDRDFVDLTPKVIYHYEWPYSFHPHSVPFMMVSGLARQSGVKAVLTGEGADECFLGYSRTAQQPLWNCVERIGGAMRRIIRAVPRLGHAIWPSDGERAVLIGDAFNQFERRMIRERIRLVHLERMGAAPNRNMATLDELIGHIPTLLHRNDRMGMSVGIEARFPFLAEELVRACINLPFDRKIRWSPRFNDRSHPFLRDKWILRRLAERYLPRHLSQRKKHGFRVNTLSRMRITPAYFYDSYIRDFLRLSHPEFDQLYDSATHHIRLKLMFLDVWGKLFVRGMAPEELQDELRAAVTVRCA